MMVFVCLFVCVAFLCLCVQAEALQGFLDEADSRIGLSVEKKASVIPRVRTRVTLLILGILTDSH